MPAPRRAARRSTLSALAGALVMGLVAVAPVAIGTVHPVTRAVVFAGCALAAGAVWLDRVRRGRSLPLAPPLIALAVCVAATALQLVPLPASVIGAVSPAAD